MTRTNADHVVVIGGGVIGAMCAWNLVEAGCNVTIVEKDKFGAVSYTHLTLPTKA